MNTITEIEWKPYEGETVNTNLIIRKGEKIQETAFYEDRVKAVPEGNDYCIGNGPSRKDFDLNKLGEAIEHNRDYQFTYLGLQTLYDRYFIHYQETRYELPQIFFMRVENLVKRVNILLAESKSAFASQLFVEV